MESMSNSRTQLGRSCLFTVIPWPDLVEPISRLEIILQTILVNKVPIWDNSILSMT
jgi:hypothetical protein